MLIRSLIYSGCQYEAPRQATGSETQIGDNNPQLDDGNGTVAAGRCGGSDGSSGSRSCKASTEQESEREEKTPEA